MSYCESFCRTIQRLCNSQEGSLPADYQQVEYLESSGTQYIITGVQISSELETHCKGQIVTTSNYTALAGGRNNEVSSGLYIPYGVNTGSALRICYGGTNATTSALATSVNEIVLNDSQHRAYVNGSLVHTYTNTLNENNRTYFTLFGLNGYNGVVNWKGKGRLFYLKLYNNTTGAKLGDFIPCYRIADDKPGMYDLVTNTFFTNAGTGEFTVGNNV